MLPSKELHKDYDLFAIQKQSENPSYLSSQIITYIGNKRKLLGFIDHAIQELYSIIGKEKISFLDLFSGSGIVSRVAKKYTSLLVANDLEKYSYTLNKCYLSNASNYPRQRVLSEITKLNNLFSVSPKYDFISEMYSPADEMNIKKEDRVFYTKRNSLFLDTVVPQILRLVC